MPEIPEEHRRRALFAALYHHDGIESRGIRGGEPRRGSTVTVDFDPTLDDQAMSDARVYVKAVAGALGYSFSSRGQFEAELRPDTEHALATLRSL